MRLTKKVRHEIYQEALEEASRRTDDCLCCWLTNKASNLCCYLTEDMRKLKEVYKHKPPRSQFWKNEDGVEYWFNTNKAGYEKRIKILKQAIEETK